MPSRKSSSPVVKSKARPSMTSRSYTSGMGCQRTRPPCDVVECTPNWVTLILHLADEMQSHVPFVSGAMEGVGEPSGFVVPLENQDALAGVSPKQDRRG
jgi:hypothetical protein